MEKSSIARHISGRDVKQEETPASDVGKLEGTQERTRTALLLAEDRQTNKKIARKVGLHFTTLCCRKKYLAFLLRVGYNVEEFADAANLHGIA